jgi:hypothetical protein
MSGYEILEGGLFLLGCLGRMTCAPLLYPFQG